MICKSRKPHLSFPDPPSGGRGEEINMLGKVLVSVVKGAGYLAYSCCLYYTVTHHVISYVVVSIIMYSSEGDNKYKRKFS